MELFLTIAAAIYSLRLLFFASGQLRAGVRRGNVADQKRVSIIIPARNEEHNLHRCIASLHQLQYPEHLLEIVFVNDRSTDNTASIINQAAESWSVIRTVHRTEADARENLRGKPGALQSGIDAASGDVYLFTDADCVVEPQWIRTMLAPFANSNVKMVCGFTTIEHSSAFGILQDIEWLYTHSMAQGSLTNHIPIGCFGNNMAIDATAFRELGGYNVVAFSVTEDLALLQAMVRTGHKVAYICSATSAVETLPCTTLAEYLQQKQRWVRGGTQLGWRATMFVITSVMYWTGLVLSIVTQSPGWTLTFLALRAVGDGQLINLSVVRLRRWSSIPAIAPSLIILLLLELILPILTLRKKVQWKGQTF
ncbi:MAG: glycosyltransferase [Ignavibacteria bacterium]|jgi:cellulose synthase/poly-beta-1,6-N-acetylglucosamine synthase-like glycosyltransferase